MSAAAPRIAEFPLGKPDGNSRTLFLKILRRNSSIYFFVGEKIKSPAAANPPKRIMASGLV